jgi:methionyl aminopeptidase
MIRLSGQTDSQGRRVKLHDAEDFDAMRRAGRVAAETLDFITPHIRPGVSTAALDRLLDGYMREQGAVAATIGYRGYRHASCISVNHVVTHGIPNDAKRLADGDILNVDVTPRLDGWHGDSSRMYVVGAISVQARRLIDATFEAMMAAIATVRPDAALGDIGAAVMAVARRERFSIVEDFTGHGIGRVFHDAPEILHIGRAGTGLRLEPGMIFTIEPMLNAGRPAVKILPDGWTTVTRDRSLSAQFEHSVGVTETGVEIFTTSPLGYHRPSYPGL